MTFPEEGSIKFRVQQAKTWDMLSVVRGDVRVFDTSSQF
jgi:hypothetical protein